MAFALAGTTITQSGTDNNLSGLFGIAGVTRDPSTRKYTLSGMTLNITGSLIIDPEVNELIFDNSCPWPHIAGRSGATLQIGSKKTINGKVRYSKGTAITSIRDSGGGPPTFDINQYGLFYTENNFTLKCYGGVINTPSGFSFAGTNNGNTGATGCTLDVEELELNNTSTLGNRLAALYFLGTNVNIINLKVKFTGINFPWDVRNDRGFPSAASFVLGHANINTDFQSNTAKLFSNMVVADNQDSKDIQPRVQNGGAQFYDTWTDSDVGSAVRVVTDATDRQGQGIFKANIIISSKDIPGANVDAKFYIEDTVGANAFITAASPATIDLNLQNTYTFVASLGSATQQILLGAYRKIAFQAPTRHYRSNSGTDADDYIVSGFKYGKNIITIPFVAKGINGVNLVATFSDDGFITESNKAVVDTYSTQETPAKAYDSLASYLEDNYVGQQVMYFVTDLGKTVIDAGSFDVEVDGTVTGSPTVVGNKITIFAPMFQGDITTTGVVTKINGASVNGLITDQNLDSVFTFTNITSWEIYPTIADRTAKTNLIASGTGSEGYNFQNLGLDYFFAVTTSTGTENNLSRLAAEYVTGKNDVSLDNTALLLQLITGQEQVRENQDNINNGVQKASLIIPHTDENPYPSTLNPLVS